MGLVGALGVSRSSYRHLLPRPLDARVSNLTISPTKLFTLEKIN